MDEHGAAGPDVVDPPQVVADRAVVVLAVDVEDVDRPGPVLPGRPGSWTGRRSTRSSHAEPPDGLLEGDRGTDGPAKSRAVTKGSTAVTRTSGTGRGEDDRRAAVVAADLDDDGVRRAPRRPRPTGPAAWSRVSQPGTASTRGQSSSRVAGRRWGGGGLHGGWPPPV